MLFTLGLLVPTGLWAQNPWTLEQCINYAWENNISIKQQKLTAEQYKNLYQQSKLNFIPSISAGASYGLSWGRSVNMNDLEIVENQLSQSFNPSVRASVNLFEGLQKFNTVAKNSADYNAVLQDVENVRNKISMEIARAFLQVLLAEEVLSTAEKSRESVSQQLELTRKLVAAGSQPYSTLLEIDAQLGAEEIQFVNARNQVDLSYLALRQLLDINPGADFTITAPVIEVDPLQRVNVVSDVYGQAQALPQIRSAALRKESAQYALAIARGRYWPTISFSASYGTYFSDPHSNNDDFWKQLGDNRSPALSFGINIPIFQNWNIVTGAKNAKLSLRMAELEENWAHQTLYKEIQQAVADATAAYNRYKASQQTVTSMQESFRYTQQKFEVGLVQATDYTVSKNNLFKAESEMLQAKYQYVFQLKIIDFYKGIPITL